MRECCLYHRDRVGFESDLTGRRLPLTKFTTEETLWMHSIGVWSVLRRTEVLWGV